MFRKSMKKDENRHSVEPLSIYLYPHKVSEQQTDEDKND